MRTGILVTSALLAVLGAPASGQAPLAERVPSETLLYLGWAGRSLAFDGSVMGQLLAEPGVGDLLGAIRQVIAEKLPPDRPAEIFHHAWSLAGMAWQHPVAIALVDLRHPGSGQAPAVGAVLIELGNNSQDFQKHLDGILALLGEQVPVAEKADAAGSYKLLALPMQIQLCLGFKDGVFFAAVGEDLAKKILAMAPADSLASSKAFLDARQSIAGDNEQLSFYLDVSALRERLEKMIGAGGAAAEPGGRFRQIVDALGVGKTTALAGSVRIVNRGMYTKVRLRSPGPHVGLLKPLAGPPLADGDLDDVPADADLLCAIKLSPKALYDEFGRVLGQIEPRARARLDRDVARIETKLGVSVADDVLDSLGDTCILSMAPSQGGFLTGTVLTVQVKDSEKFAAAVAKIESAFGFRPASPPATAPAEPGPQTLPALATRPSRPVIRTVQAGRTEIHYVAPRGRIPFAPAWAIHEGRFYLAGWPQVIESTIDNVGPDKRSARLIDDPRFVELRKQLTGKPSALMYVNWPKIFRQIYPVQLVAGTMIRGWLAGQMDLPSMLPGPMALSKIQKYTWPEIAAVCWDEKGITFEAYGSQPSVALVAPVVTAAAVPALASARRKANEVRQLGGVRMIAACCLLYAEDHDGWGPTSLTEGLAPYVGMKDSTGEYLKLIDGLVLVGPGARLPDVDGAAEVILVYTQPKGGDRHVLAAFVDGHSERVPIAEFPRRLEYSQKQLKQVAGPPPRGDEDFQDAAARRRMMTR